MTAVLLVTAGCEQPAAPAAEPPLAVRVATVEHRPLEHRLHYVGTVRSAREVTVTARVPGTLAALPAGEGEHAGRDAVLATVDTPDLEARLAQTQAEQRRAHAEVEYLCGVYETDQRLGADGVLQRAQVDASQRMCRNAEAGGAAADARARELRSTLDKRIERAPFAGRVLSHLAEPGEHVAPGRPLLVLGDDALELHVLVTERDLAHGIRGDTPVVVMQGDQEIASHVTEVGHLARGPGRAVDVRVALPAEAADIRHGTSMDVAFVLAREAAAAAVPADAIATSAGGPAVYVIEGDIARQHRVRTGITAGGWVAIEPPLAVGTPIAVTNLDALADGTPVYPVSAQESVR